MFCPGCTQLVTEQETNERTQTPETKAHLCDCCGIMALHDRCMTQLEKIAFNILEMWMCLDCRQMPAGQGMGRSISRVPMMGVIL